MLKKPDMVFFDFGGTLVYDGEFKPECGLEALRLAADNPDVTTTQEMLRLWKNIFTEVRGKNPHRAEFNFDIPISNVFKNIFTRLGLKYSISSDDCEVIFDMHNSTRSPTPYIKELLDALKDKGIRSGVISNIAMTGSALKKSIDIVLPENRFECIITSRDYIVCKPASDLFEVALSITGVKAQSCWFCGDTFQADVLGPLGCGMTAIHYDLRAEEQLTECETDGMKYLSISNWRGLLAEVENF